MTSFLSKNELTASRQQASSLLTITPVLSSLYYCTSIHPLNLSTPSLLFSSTTPPTTPRRSLTTPIHPHPQQLSPTHTFFPPSLRSSLPSVPPYLPLPSLLHPPIYPPTHPSLPTHNFQHQPSRTVLLKTTTTTSNNNST